MYVILLFLFLQFPSAQDYYKMESPVAELQRAETVIANRQKAVEDAIKNKTDIERQIAVRTQEKNTLIETVKARNHLDASWSWDDKQHKFVQKK